VSNKKFYVLPRKYKRNKVNFMKSMITSVFKAVIAASCHMHLIPNKLDLQVAPGSFLSCFLLIHPRSQQSLKRIHVLILFLAHIIILMKAQLKVVGSALHFGHHTINYTRNLLGH